MKKVWIASIFACIMLMVPLTNVIGALDTVEDCNCKPVNDLQVVRIERLLNRLESRINFILLRYGHIPEVEEKCEEVLDIIDSNDLSTFCTVIGILGLICLGLTEALLFPALFALIFYIIWMTFCE